MFSGSICALITPFREGNIDEDAFSSLVNWQIAEGTNALVPMGTTGESPTVSHEEHKRVVELCIDVADKRVPVIAGAGSNSTAEAIDLAEHARAAGADAALVVTPYYNKPTQEGLYRHFEALNSAGIPLIIYNIPGRSVIDMHAAWHRGDVAEAQRLNECLTPLHADLFCEANPAPVKYGASLLGKCREELRLPLVPINNESRGKVERAMRHAGLLG